MVNIRSGSNSKGTKKRRRNPAKKITPKEHDIISQSKQRGIKDNNSISIDPPNFHQDVENSDQNTNLLSANNKTSLSKKDLIKCKYCGKMRSKNSIYRHIKAHTDPKSLHTTCDICGDTVRKEYLNKHRLQHTNPESLFTICDICGDTISKNWLTMHQRIHTNPESLHTTCDICGDTLRKEYLDKHRLQHTDPKSLYTTCDICGDTVRKDYLKKHRRIHTDPESFQATCNICGDIVRKDNLEKHQLINTDPESLYTTCDICGDTVRKDGLIRHRLIHTDPENLYTTCDICGITIRKDKLKNHKNGILCLYESDIAYKWENIGKEIAEILLSGQKWQWKPKISLDKLQLFTSIDQQSIIPEIVIYQNDTIDTIIDLKSSIYSLKDKDFNIYPFIAKNIIFWILKGESCFIEHKNHKLQFISSDDLIKILTKQNSLEVSANLSIPNIINAIQTLTSIPEEIYRLKSSFLDKYL